MDLDEAERIWREWTPSTPKSVRPLLAELTRLRAALANAQAEIARLRPYLDKAQAHTCPAPEWYPKVRDLLGEVVLAAAFARTDLAELPGHVAELRKRALVDAAPADGSLLAERDAEIAELTGEVARLRAAVDVHALAEEIHDAIVGAGGDCPDVDDGNDSMCEHVAERIVRALAAAPAPAALHRGECYRACGCDDTAREQADPADEGGDRG